MKASAMDIESAIITFWWRIFGHFGYKCQKEYLPSYEKGKKNVWKR